MEKFKVIRAYNFVNASGGKLQLNLGVVDRKANVCCHDDRGWRWQFIGKEIPMPVRSGTLFNGFPEPIMIDWLKGNGWFLHTRVNMYSGKANVYEVPKVEEDRLAWPIHSQLERRQFDDAIRYLYENGKRSTAIRTYLYAHGGHLKDAVNAVREIVDQSE